MEILTRDPTVAEIASVHPKLRARFGVRRRRIERYWTCDEGGRIRGCAMTLPSMQGNPPSFPNGAFCVFFVALRLWRNTELGRW